MMFRDRAPGRTPANIAGMMAKYLAMSLAMENVVSEPRVIRSCLPISTISMSLVGFESRSTMFPASFAACVPVFMATPTSGLSERGSVVGAVAGHRDQAAARLLPPDQRHLVLRRRLGEEVVDARLLRDGGCGQRVVAGDHHRADAHGSKLVEAARSSPASPCPSAGSRRGCAAGPSPGDRRPASGVAPSAEMPSTIGASSIGTAPPSSMTSVRTESAAPLRTERPPTKSIPLIRV
jgi:hypothetical protein